jgi:hypothetical protein
LKKKILRNFSKFLQIARSEARLKWERLRDEVAWEDDVEKTLTWIQKSMSSDISQVRGNRLIGITMHCSSILLSNISLSYAVYFNEQSNSAVNQ